MSDSDYFKALREAVEDGDEQAAAVFQNAASPWDGSTRTSTRRFRLIKRSHPMPAAIFTLCGVSQMVQGGSADLRRRPQLFPEPLVAR